MKNKVWIGVGITALVILAIVGWQIYTHNKMPAASAATGETAPKKSITLSQANTMAQIVYVITRGIVAPTQEQQTRVNDILQQLKENGYAISANGLTVTKF